MDMTANDTMDMSMKMYFHASAHATILFQGWHTMNAGQLFGSCVAIIVLAILYEGLRLLRVKLAAEDNKCTKCSVIPVESSPIKSKSDNIAHFAGSTQIEQTSRFGRRTLHIITTLLHMLNVFVSYCLMLVFMTYNVYLCLSVVIGAGVGYLIFFWKTTPNSADLSSENHCN